MIAFYSLNFTGGLIIISYVVTLRGISSAGRALRWQRRGQRFDPAMLHYQKPIQRWIGSGCRENLDGFNFFLKVSIPSFS